MAASALLAHELPTVEVVATHGQASDAANAASQDVIRADTLRDRALLRPAEVLEYIPGMVVTQHSGDGKANQYFLRGMNLDHGTDFATTVNGVPLNLPTHAHGQGYSDANVLIPELVERIHYRKGPYFASEGDFSSAGSADMAYRSQLDRPLASVAVGQGGYLRSLVAGSAPVGEGLTLLTALERLNNNGPWTVPEGMRKTNAQLILSGGSRQQGWRTSLSSYTAHWHATDQVPQRLLDAGTYLGQAFGRFDALDPSDGAQTRRTSLSGSWHQSLPRESTRLEGYVLQYSLKLYSNFTYALDRANDQFGQMDDRSAWGAKAQQSWTSEAPDGRSTRNTLGVQLRQDRIRVGLYNTVNQQIQATVRDDDVRQTLAGVYAESDTAWTPWFRTVSGVRADQFQAQVSSRWLADNSGSSRAAKVSPKLSVILGPWAKTVLFINAGQGFHSNDARGTTARTDPQTGAPANAVPGLVGSRGRELGLRSSAWPDWETAVALWQLDLDSELLYRGDAGNTEPGRASRRTGVEWSNHWTPGKHLRVDANLAWTRPRYLGNDPQGAFIPNAVQKVMHLNVALRQLGPWSGSLGLRCIGSAPLTPDNAVRSAASTTANLRIARRLSADVDLALDVLNLTDRRNHDISYWYNSRLPGEAAGVGDVHAHPAEPRTLRMTAQLHW